MLGEVWAKKKPRFRDSLFYLQQSEQQNPAIPLRLTVKVKAKKVKTVVLIESHFVPLYYKRKKYFKRFQYVLYPFFRLFYDGKIEHSTINI